MHAISPARRMLFHSTAALLVFCISVFSAPIAGEKQAAETVVDFSEGKWDPAQWRPILVPPQTKTVRLAQKEDAIGTGTFTEEQVKKKLDNVIEVLDRGKADGEFHLTFSMEAKAGTAPGVVLWPELEGDSLRGGIGVFVASYCMAVWELGYDAEKGEVTYLHLARLGRYQDPATRHVLRCRLAKNGTVSLQIDDSDILILRKKETAPNSLIGIWGCHGACDFHKIVFPVRPSLPFGGVSKPKE